MICTVTLNPALDQTVTLETLTLGKVNRGKSYRADAGGKGINVSKTIDALEGQSLCMALLGGDTGKSIYHELLDNEIACDVIWTDAPTRVNVILLDEANAQCTNVNLPGAPISEEILREFSGRLLSRISRGDVAVLSGSLPQGAPEDYYALIIRALREKGCRVILDTSGEALRQGVKAAPDVIKPNIDELAELTGEALHDDAACVTACRRLMKDTGIGLAALSMGGKGAMYVTSGEAIRAHAVPVKVRSTTGAGDAMTAALALSLSEGRPLIEMAKYALAASAAKVMLEGTQSPHMQDVMRLLPQCRAEAI